jgi:hypothetical protein
MTTTRQRLEALDEIARSSGKTRQQVLAAVGPSWALDFGELAHLRSAMANTPEPATNNPAAAKSARAQADEAERQAQTAAVLTFREYQRQKEINPFTAASFREQNAHQIEIGRELDQPDPPLTAA